MIQVNRTIHLFLAGDSTVADYPDSQAPMAGWGQYLGDYFFENIMIHNIAACGKSSKSFIEEGYFKKIMDELDEGDYLFVQFGHNDEKPQGTKAFTTFKDYLTQYISSARKKGAFPILLTPVQRRHFNEYNKLKQTHGDFPIAIRELAEVLNVPLIDLTVKTNTLYETLGPEKSKELFVWFEPNEHPNYPEGIEDNTHFRERGAKQVAQLVILGLLEIEPKLPLVEWIRKHGDDSIDSLCD